MSGGESLPSADEVLYAVYLVNIHRTDVEDLHRRTLLCLQLAVFNGDLRRYPGVIVGQLEAKDTPLV